MGTGFVLAAPNHLGLRFSNWLATSEASASMADSNLATSSPGQFWRSTGHNPWLTSARGYNLLSNDFSGSEIDTFALCCHNLRPVTGRWRVRLYSQATDGALPTWVKPNSAIGAWGNVTGTYTDVDEDPTGALDGNKLTPTSTALSMTAIHMGFETPAHACAIGSLSNPLQAFVLDVNIINTAGPDADIDAASQSAPYIRVQLYEGGALVRDLKQKIVHSAAGQALIFPWDASELASAAGADVEIFIDTFSNGGDYRIEVQRLGWWQESIDYENTPYLIADSGWLTAVDDPAAGTAFAAFHPTRRTSPEHTSHRFSALSETPQLVSTVQFLLMDDHAQTFDNNGFQGWIPITPDNYLQVAVGFAGRAFVAEVDRELGPLVGVRDLSVKTITDGGSGGGRQGPRLRKLYTPWDWLTSAEGAAIFERVCIEGSINTSHVVVLLPDSTTERRLTTLYCTPDLPEVDLTAPRNSLTYNRGLSLTWLENR